MSEILPSGRIPARGMGLEGTGDLEQPSEVSGGGLEVGHHTSHRRLGCHAVLVWWKGIQEGNDSRRKAGAHQEFQVPADPAADSLPWEGFFCPFSLAPE